MIGAIIIVVAVVVIIPVAVLMSGGAAAPLVGWFLKTDAEERHEGSELLETNV